jgi:hypothetical protein
MRLERCRISRHVCRRARHRKREEVIVTDGTERKGWSGYHPSKAVWFWSCAGCVVATIALGFTWGGWVTGGAAAHAAQEAREQGRAELAATVCVERFISAVDARTQLVALKDESSWARDDFVQDGGWATIADATVAGAADLCADQLASMELPAEEPKVEEASASTQEAIAPEVEAN